MVERIHHSNEMYPEVQMLKILGKELYKSGLLLVGGSIWCAYRGLSINDIDIMSMTGVILLKHEQEQILKGAISVIDGSTPSSIAFPYHRSPFANNFLVNIGGKGYKVQFITPSEGIVKTPQEIINSFDITNCGLYISEKGLIHSFYEEYDTHGRIMNNTLSIGKVSDAAHTILRLNKYTSRGAHYDSSAITELMTIHQALSMYKLINQIEEDFEEGAYETLVTGGKTFTVSDAHRYLRENAKMVIEAISEYNNTEEDPWLNTWESPVSPHRTIIPTPIAASRTTF